MDVPAELLPDDQVESEWLRDRLITLAEQWARNCIDARHAEVIELFPADRQQRYPYGPQRAT
jgi:hypothetical protein